MAREIKFRAWDKENEKIKSVTQLDFEHYGGFQAWLNDEDTSYLDEDIELMQYTGLKDKNGVEIYEGDILEITGNYKPGKYIVIWDYYRVAWWGRNIKCDKREREYDDDHYQLLGAFQNDITEIIGDVYQNPELLEVE